MHILSWYWRIAYRLYFLYLKNDTVYRSIMLDGAPKSHWTNMARFAKLCALGPPVYHFVPLIWSLRLGSGCVEMLNLNLPNSCLASNRPSCTCNVSANCRESMDCWESSCQNRLARCHLELRDSQQSPQRFLNSSTVSARHWISPGH